MDEPSADLITFGLLLQRLRTAKGISLSMLARQVHYSKGQLSKIEHGTKRVTAEFASLCDEILETGGALRGRWTPAPPRSRVPRQPVPASSPQFADMAWALAMSADGSGELWEDGVAVAFDRPAHPPPASAHWSLFGAIRDMGRVASPASVLQLAQPQFGMVNNAIAGAVDRPRHELTVVASRMAEYLGWMWQEAGNDAAALRWTDRAVALADAADDQNMREYAAVRRALVLLYQGRAADVIAEAERVGDHASPRVRFLAALRSAQGHALAGDHAASMRAIDRASRLLAAADEPSDGEAAILGPSGRADRVGAVLGWCLVDLRRYPEAAAVLERVIGSMPAGAREYQRFGARLALAHLFSGDVHRACTVMNGLLDGAIQVDSATIRTDLSAFGRAIDSHADVGGEAQALRQRLTRALRTTPRLDSAA